jgi:hypothetical protein
VPRHARCGGPDGAKLRPTTHEPVAVLPAVVAGQLVLPRYPLVAGHGARIGRHGVVMGPHTALAEQPRTARPCQPLAVAHTPCTAVPAVALGHAALPSSGSAAQNATARTPHRYASQLGLAHSSTRHTGPHRRTHTGLAHGAPRAVRIARADRTANVRLIARRRRDRYGRRPGRCDRPRRIPVHRPRCRRLAKDLCRHTHTHTQKDRQRQTHQHWSGTSEIPHKTHTRTHGYSRRRRWWPTGQRRGMRGQ